MALCLSSASSCLFAPTLLPQRRSNKGATTQSQAFFCCCSSSGRPNHGPTTSHDSKLVHIIEQANKNIVKLALVAAVAGLVAFSPPTEDALAAKSGGRVGGQAFRSAPPPSAGPRVDSRRTNIYINPPPLFGGYGVPYYGGWGWSPFSFFAPGPSIAIGVGGGFGFFSFLLLMSVIIGIFNFFRRRDDDDYYD